MKHRQSTRKDRKAREEMEWFLSLKKYTKESLAEDTARWTANLYCSEERLMRFFQNRLEPATVGDVLKAFGFPLHTRLFEKAEGYCKEQLKRLLANGMLRFEDPCYALVK